MALTTRRQLAGGFAGAVLAVSAALPGALATSGEARADPDLSCPAEITTNCADLRGNRDEVVRTAAARATVGNRVAVIYFGSNLHERTVAERVVQYFNDQGRQTGLILADGTGQFQIYVNTRHMTNAFTASGVTPLQLGEEINAAIVTSESVATAPEPTGTEG